MSFLSSLFGGKDTHGAEKAAKAAEERQAKLESDMLAEKAKIKADEESGATRDAARDKQRKQAMAAVGTRDTVLTGPLGDVTAAPKENKTLLGV